MAMLDYGAIGFKNSKLISTGFFTPMKETCGFSDKDEPLIKGSLAFDGNCFLTIGNEEVVIGFYKASMKWWLYCTKSDSSIGENTGIEWFDYGYYHKWKYWERYFDSDNYVIQITVKPRNGYFVAKVEILDIITHIRTLYKVYFGYGVDLGFYERTRRVNYYRSPEHALRLFRYRVKHALVRIKYRKIKKIVVHASRDEIERG